MSGLQALWELPAPAKLNRFLHVIGRREDGYHRLESVFVLIDWADTLHLERRGDGRLQRHDLGPALPAEDLTLRAAAALQRASGTAWGVDISVLKRVPWGAGLGGGSSDAATVLLGLNRLWGLHWPRARLLALAATLGADVPFFVGGANAFVQGAGEQLAPVAVAPQAYAVVHPGVALSTADVFREAARQAGGRWRAPLDAAAILSGSFGGAGAAGDRDADAGSTDPGFGNDLQAAAEQLCPPVAEAARWLGSQGGRGRMTGSGSAVFAVWPSVPASAAAGEGSTTGAPLTATFPTRPVPPGWTVRLCRGLTGHPLAAWAD